MALQFVQILLATTWTQTSPARNNVENVTWGGSPDLCPRIRFRVVPGCQRGHQNGIRQDLSSPSDIPWPDGRGRDAYVSTLPHQAGGRMRRVNWRRGVERAGSERRRAVLRAQNRYTTSSGERFGSVRSKRCIQTQCYLGGGGGAEPNTKPVRTSWRNPERTSSIDKPAILEGAANKYNARTNKDRHDLGIGAHHNLER